MSLSYSHLTLILLVIFVLSLSGMMTPGNKSSMILLKRGMSKDRNLGMLESCMALIKIISYSTSGSARLRLPAMTNTLLTALMPKS